ncbi:MAG: 5'-nucleotidase C-terminal domain-containing protein [Marinibacterium sp.]|nr:5'-nucleotidase C-terminal domain-containing protein [Marinibacterium sp.]
MTQTDPVHLRILGTTDLHMNLRGWDYYGDRPQTDIGLTRTAALIRRARTEAEDAGGHCLLFDNGDSLQGTPLVHGLCDDDTAHPLMQCFGALGYDAIGLGNHDFNFGLPKLARILRDAPCPVICSNLIWPERPALPLVPHLMITRDTAQGVLRIGVLSVLPPQTLDWDKHLLAGKLAIAGMAASARDTARHLRATGADLVIALAHTGFGERDAHRAQENALRPLAALPEIDAIVAGHTHQAFPGPHAPDAPDIDATMGRVHGTPVVMAASAGSCLGVIDLWLERPDDATGWQLRDGRGSLRNLASTPADEDPALVALLAPYHERARASMNTRIGQFDRAMHSYFAFVAPDPALALVAAAQAWGVRRVLAGTEPAGLPLLSAVSPSKSGGRNGPWHYTDVPKGHALRRHILDLQVFPNDLRAVVVTGDQIRDWLEMSATVLQQVAPGSQGVALTDFALPGYNFDVIYGLEYSIDLSQPPRFRADGSLISPDHRRIAELTHDGRPVAADARFLVALNNYRLNGGGHFQALRQAVPVPVPRMRIAQLVEDYVQSRDKDPLDSAPPPWRLMPQQGTEIRVRTGPGARAYLDGTRFRDCGLDADGFLWLSMDLSPATVGTS